MSERKEDAAKATARKMVKAWIQAVPGWVHAIPNIRDAILTDINNTVSVPGRIDIEAGIKADLCLEVNRILDDLTDISPERMLTDYVDFLPKTLRDEIFSEAIKVVQSMGLSVDIMKDDEGEDFIRVVVPDDCNLPQEDLEELERLSAPYQAEGKRLHRVQ